MDKNMMNAHWNIARLPLIWLAFFMVGCGGSSSDKPVITIPDVPPVLVDPPVDPASIVYGLYEISLVNGDVMQMLLTNERSYIFSVAKNTLPPKEQMCLTNEALLEFSESLPIQTLNFNCSDDEESSINAIIELKDGLITVDYNSEKISNTTIPLTGIVQITTPHFSKLTSGSYKTPIRNDINVSRLIAASSREDNIWVNVASRDIPIGGQCHDSLIFEINDLSSVEITNTYERVSIPYRSTDTLPVNNCVGSLLPNPSQVENIDVHFYTLANGRYFTVIEQNSFITMGVLYKEF